MLRCLHDEAGLGQLAQVEAHRVGRRVDQLGQVGRTAGHVLVHQLQQTSAQRVGHRLEHRRGEPDGAGRRPGGGRGGRVVGHDGHPTDHPAHLLAHILLRNSRCGSTVGP
ncbi:hypothetical protein [Ornithinimicrobium kibberense]|uniref:hypothetical protein n=1 Tax=Ornithinimicrobium kibberense TaxID=282060 RepID=UPI0036199070